MCEHVIALFDMRAFFQWVSVCSLELSEDADNEGGKYMLAYGIAQATGEDSRREEMLHPGR